MTAPSIIRIYSRPSIDHENPYFRLLYRALSEHAIEYRGLFPINDDWLRQHAGELDAVHLHWPEFMWRVDGRTRARQIVGLLRFLRLAGSLKIQRVWTVHNLPPHEPQTADFIGLWLLAREIDLFVCHSNDVNRRLLRWLHPGAGKSIVKMCVGNYDGVYPAASDQAAFVNALGIPEDRTIVSVFGRMRRYKGIETAIRASRLLPSSMHLVIAGTPVGDISQLRRDAAAAPRVTLIDRELSDQELSNLLDVSAVTWLPYRRISTSAALLLALTAGRGVIATDLPFFREVLSGADDAGRLVLADSPEALAASTLDYLKVPADRRSAAARAVADTFAWNRVVADFARTLRTRVGD